MSADALIAEARAASRRIAPGVVRVTFLEDGEVLVYARPYGPDRIDSLTAVYHGPDVVSALAALRSAYPMTEAA